MISRPYLDQCERLFTHESVMNALVRDLSSSSSTSSAFAADKRFTCLVINDSQSCLSSHQLKKLSQSMRDTYMDASCKNKPLSLLSNNGGAGNGDIIHVKFCKSDCFDCQITSPKSIRASMLDCIQSLEKSTENRFNIDHLIFSNGLIKLVQSLKDTRITSLNLSDNEISSDMMIDLAQFLHSTQIKSLDLSRNCIQQKGFDYLNKFLRETQISSLNISKNVSMHTVTHVKRPSRFSSSLKSKEILRKSLAEIFDKPASKYLDLSCNFNPVDLKYVASIVKNSKIEHLDLTGVSINMEIFAPNLVYSSINTLNLAGCKLGTDGIKILASVLKNTNIQSLDLSNTNIKCECLKVFAPYLIESQIAYLNLSKNRFDRDGINSLAIVLPNTRIVSLDLNYCSIGNRNLEILSASLVHTKITSLGFKGNVPNDYDTKSLAVGVKDSQISSIDLGSNEAVDMVHLLSLCMVGSKLTSITLSECIIDCSVMEDLVIALRNTNTTSINLIGTYMTCEVMKIFVSCLVNSKITNLHMSNGRDDKLDIGAVECLALTLKDTQISSLDLSENQLDCESLKVLAPCLVDTKLQHLNLEENKLDYANYFDEEVRNYEGVECLVLALKKSQIINLNLANNALTCKSLINLILSLSDTKITTLDLSGNELYCNVFYLANVLKSTQISSLALRNIQRNRRLSNTSHYKVSNTYYQDLSGMQCTFRLYYLFHMNQAEKIMILNLSRNEMSCCAKLKELCQFLSNSQIISLDLSDNRINCDGVYYLAQVLQSTKISSLNLANNEISTNGVQHLVLKLPGSQLKSLDLSHNLITDESIECLCGNLAYTKYADLNLRGNKIGRQAVDHLCKNVAEINVQFDLPNDDFSHHIDLCKYPGCVIEIYQTSFEKGIDYFNKFVCDKTDITKVYIRSSCKNGLPFFRDLAKIVSNINISEIEMGEYSRIPYSVFANIAQLKCNGTGSWFSPVVLNRVLIELKFQNIKKNCFQDLAKLCLNNIMYLDLSHIDLEEDKFIFFAQALKNNTMDQNKNNYLISLNLSNNKLGAKSAKLLAEVLPYNIPSLTYIDLHGNKIGYSGFKSLMEVVDKTSLCWLSLGDNNIEDQLQESIELSPYIVPRKDDETPVAFQVRYLFRQLVSMNTCSGELEFTIPTTDSNPPVNITHYPKLLKIYSAFENDVKYLNVQVYDNYYMKSKRHDRRLLEKIEKFGNEIEKRFLSFINSISNQTKLEQAFGYDSFVVLVRECERLELNECVESLLLHRVLYYVDDDEEILHPFIYRMMHKYSMPLYCKQIEPNKRKQIIAYYKNHPEIEEAEALIDLLASMSTEEN